MLTTTMKNYLSLKDPNAILISTFGILFLGCLLGIRFENIYINKIAGLLLYIFPIYVFVLVLKHEFKSKTIKVILSMVFGLFALGILLPIFFSVFNLYSISQNGGVDSTMEKVRALDLRSSRVVVYRINGGATTDFSIVVSVERPVLLGVYIKHDLFKLYHVDDVNLSMVTPSSIKVDSISFTSPQYRSDYMDSSPEITDGSVIKF